MTPIAPSPIVPAQGRLSRTATFAPHDEERQRQDFCAGSVPAAGAGVIVPVGAAGSGGPADAGTLPSVFLVYLHEDERTFGPAPQLRDAFALLDEHGAMEVVGRLDLGTAWSGFGGARPLVKLRLEFPGPHPARGAVSIVVPAEEHAEVWHHIVGGGLLGLTTRERLERATAGPRASFAAGLEACVLVGVGTSPVLEKLITAYGWPWPRG
uniref:Uncharacterized protein n=1 Tax=Streptomyces sp. NBC_00049 TaxID=2903617 RepID=A0AAU2JZ76_9ACTN